MKIFGTTFPFVESATEEDERSGRPVANYEFLKALLNYSSFDRFHLFCTSPAHAQNTVNKLKSDASISAESKTKVSVLLLDTLKEQLRETVYHCFHCGDFDYHFSTLVYLRNAYAKENFPVTGITHALNNAAGATHAFGLIKSAAQVYDAIFCTSASAKEVLQKRLAIAKNLEQNGDFCAKLSQIPLGYDAALDTKITKTDAKTTVNFEQDTKYILYLGRLSPSSKADLYPLLSVFKTLKQKCKFKIKLVLAGGVNPSELRVHKEIIRELGLDFDVQLMINFDLAKKNALISAAHLCVAPSDNIQETFGISVIEAMACGVPVVASDIDGYKDLIVQNETGFRVKTTWIDEFEPCEMDVLYTPSVMQIMLAQAFAIDCDEMEEKIFLLLSDEKLRENLGENARKIAAQNYRWQGVIEQYEKEWDALKEEAKNSQKPQSFAQNPYCNKYLEAFSHYPTRILGQNSLLAMTRDGEDVLDGVRQIPPAYSECSIMLDLAYLREVMEFLRHTAKASVKEILAQFPDENTKGRFTILWAVKYRLLRFAQNEDEEK